MTTADLPFAEDPAPVEEGNLAHQLVLHLDGYDGPIDVLVALARDQKVDLLRISVLQLAEQYLEFVAAARESNIELAADYLVMAAWLAYLKSRLLLPAEEAEDEPTGEELAAALQFQLKRLEAMQNAGAALFERALLGRERFTIGQPESTSVITRNLYDLTLFDVLRAYGRVQSRGKIESLEIEEVELYTIDRAIERLRSFLGRVPDWTVLQNFLPDKSDNPLINRSAMCSTLIAALELAKAGRLRLRQDGGAFTPVFIMSDADTASHSEVYEEPDG